MSGRTWPEVAIGDLVVETQYGTSQKANTQGLGLPILRMNNITHDGQLDLTDVKWVNLSDADLSKYTVRKGDLLFNRTNSPELVGKTAVWNKDETYAVAGYLVRVRFNPALVIPEWVSAYLNSPDGKHMLRVRAKPSSNMSNISATDLRRFRIPLAPLPEQRRIAAILDKADAIRRKRQETIRLTEEFLRSAFLDWFGDPAANPKGWPVRRMSDVVLETQYGTAQRSNDREDGLPILRMTNITYAGTIDLRSVKWCAIAKDDLPKYTVRRGDLLFNRTNSPELVGKAAVWDRDQRFAVAGYLVRVRFQKDLAEAHYISGFLNSDYGKRYLFVKAKPSNNMSNFSAGEFLKIPLPVPPVARQREYVAFVERLRASARTRDVASEKSDLLFKSLVAKAFRAAP